MSEQWLELSVPFDGLASVYTLADEFGVRSIHHFTEPWFDGGWVVRVLLPEDSPLTADDFGVEGASWDAGPDEVLFLDAWPAVRAFFEASSRLALKRGRDDQSWYDRKVIHCCLNSWGFEVEDELSFANSVAKERKKMLKRLKKAAK